MKNWLTPYEIDILEDNGWLIKHDGDFEFPEFKFAKKEDIILHDIFSIREVLRDIEKSLHVQKT